MIEFSFRRYSPVKLHHVHTCNVMGMGSFGDVCHHFWLFIQTGYLRLNWIELLFVITKKGILFTGS